MSWIALKMLMGDRSKYLGIIFGVAFATLLMAQQMALFCGLMGRTTSQIKDVQEADIWVMDDKVRYVDEVPGLGIRVLVPRLDHDAVVPEPVDDQPPDRRRARRDHQAVDPRG